MDRRATLPAYRHHRLRSVIALVATLLGIGPVPARAYDVMLRWTTPPEPDIAEFFLYSGPTSRTYGPRQSVGALGAAAVDGVVHYLVQDVPSGTPAYFAVTACNSSALESDYSNEKLYFLTDPPPPHADAGLDQQGFAGAAFTVGGAPEPGIAYFWEQISGPAGTFASRTANGVQFTADAAGTVVLAVTAYDANGIAARDTVTLTVAPSASSPTATPSWTQTATRTPSVTRTATATRTSTSTPTQTPTHTSASTPTHTATPTASSTHTLTPTQTATFTPTHTYTHTPSHTATPTGTATPVAATATPSSTPTPLSATRHRIRGFVGYFGSLQPVPAAQVEALGTQTLVTATDQTGQFEIADLEEADWRFQPSKLRDIGDAVTALDAVYVLQTTIGLREFQPFQRTLCDVTGNGTLSALDAATILRRAVGILDSFPVTDRCGSDWLFEPVPVGGGLRLAPNTTDTECQSGAIVFRPLESDVENQSFLAGVIGDCTGSWQPTVSGELSDATTLGEPLQVSVRQERNTDGGNRRLLVAIDTATPVYAILVDVDVASAEPAANVKVRTVPAVPHLIRAIDTDNPGHVRVAVASAVPLRASGGAMVAITLAAADGASVSVDRVKVNEDREWRPAAARGANAW